MNLRRKTILGLLWSSVEHWGGKLISLLVFLILARLLSPEAFGLVALASVFIAFTTVFVDQGFADAIVQRENLEPAHLDTAFWTNSLFGILLCGLFWLLAYPLANLFGFKELSTLLQWLSLSFIIQGACGAPRALLRRRLAFKKLSFQSIAGHIISGLAAIGVALAGGGVWSLVVQQLLGQFIAGLLLWYQIPWQPHFAFSKSHFLDLFSFGINIFGANVLNFVNRHLDDLLIGSVLGPVALGYYTIAYKVLRTFTDVLASVASRVMFPVYARLQTQPDRLRSAFYLTTGLMGHVSIPLFSGLILTAPQLLPLVFGEQWMPSVPVMQVLALIGILHTLFYFNDNVMLACGKASWRLGTNFLNAAGNAIAFIIAVPWGMTAVAAAYVIRGYVLAPIPLILVRRLLHIQLSIYFKQFLAPVLATLLMVGTILLSRQFLPSSSGLILAAEITGAMALYTFLILLITPSTLQQVTSLFHFSSLEKTEA